MIVMMKEKIREQWKLGKMPRRITDGFDALAQRRLGADSRTTAMIKLLDWFLEKPEKFQLWALDLLPDDEVRDIEEKLIRSVTVGRLRNQEPAHRDTALKGSQERR